MPFIFVTESDQTVRLNARETTSLRFDLDFGIRFDMRISGQQVLRAADADGPELTVNITGGGNFSGIDGTEHDDLIIVSKAKNPDFETGLSSGYSIWGRGGDDIIKGSNGNDSFFSISEGSNRILAFRGDDQLRVDFGPSSDTIVRFGPGNDRLSMVADFNKPLKSGVTLDLGDRGWQENDKFGRLKLLDSPEQISGTRLGDHIVGTNKSEVIDGGIGKDTLVGKGGNDQLLGQGKFVGGNGDDYLGTIFGDKKIASVFKGGAGDDTIASSRGPDTMIGGRGADTFNFASDTGKDKIRDFGPEDTIYFGFGNPVDSYADLVDSHMRQSHGTTIITFGGDDSVRLIGVKIADLTESNFEFA